MAERVPAGEAVSGIRPLRTRRRLFVLGAVFVLLFAAPALAILGIRAQRVSRLRALVEERVREGLPTTFEDLRALASGVDAIEQDRLSEAMSALDALPQDAVPGDSVGGVDDASLAEWLLGPPGAPPSSLAARVEATEGAVESVTAFARRGRSAPTMVGWLPERRPDGVSIKAAAHALEVSMPASATLRAARWHRYAAVLGGDAEARLRDIEALVGAVSPTASLVEAMMASWMRYQGDRCHLELAIQGRLPTERELRFVTEVPDEATPLADAFRVEATLYGGLFAEDILAGRYPDSRLFHPEFSSKERGMFAAVWWLGPSSAATVLEGNRAAERLLRGEPRAEGMARIVRHLDDAGSVACIPPPIVEPAVRFHCLREAGARAARLGVRLVSLRRARGRLPTDEAEFRAWLGPAASGLDAGERRLGLRFERVAQDSFRLAVDPATAPPLLIVGWGDDPPEWLLGKPPSDRGLVFLDGGLEVRGSR
jgi:hypothetical protein